MMSLRKNNDLKKRKNLKIEKKKYNFLYKKKGGDFTMKTIVNNLTPVKKICSDLDK
ncbi:MAG: hypothetical protein WCL02_07970 [bacterium]